MKRRISAIWIKNFLLTMAKIGFHPGLDIEFIGNYSLKTTDFESLRRSFPFDSKLLLSLDGGWYHKYLYLWCVIVLKGQSTSFSDLVFNLKCLLPLSEEFK